MRTLLSFSDDSPPSDWVAVNDGVMGGRSSGRATVGNGMLEFSGVVSLENNGGFASVRCEASDFDLSGAAALLLRVRGDGRRYQLRLATDARQRGIPLSYGAGFSTTPGVWLDLRVPLASLTPTVRGASVSGPPLDASAVREIGLLVADRQEGEFALWVDWIGCE